MYWQPFDFLLVTSYIGIIIWLKFAQDVHQRSTELNDFHVLFLFDAHLNEQILDIDNRDVPIFLGIDDTCQNDGIYGNSW